MRVLIPTILLALLTTIAPAQEPAPTPVEARIRAAREIKVAARTSGVVVERSVPRSTLVKQGQVILVIDPVLAEIGVVKAEAALDIARADAELAKKEHERSAALAKGNSVHQSEVDRTEAARRSAEATVAAQSALVQEAREHLDRCRVRAPCDGLLIEIFPEVGEMVTTMAPVAEIHTVQDLVAEAFLRPDEVIRLKEGDPIDVVIRRPVPLRLPSRVREVTRAAGRRRSFRLVVALNDPPPEVLAGFEAEILVPAAR
jgi:RND family efflux transporter MFP subunit